MTGYKFKVRYSPKEIVILILIWIVLIGFLILQNIFYVKNISGFVISILLILLYLAMALAFILVRIFFYVEVKDSEISVRTKIGRHYTFNCSDITRIGAAKIYSKHAKPDSYDIILKTETQTLDIDCRMIDFDKMASYLLASYASGHISKSALTPYNEKILLRLSQKK